MKMISVLLVIMLALVALVCALLWYDYVKAEEEAYKELLDLHMQARARRPASRK